MFEKVLVANRGEIACRIIRSCKKLGVKTVAVHSEADSNAMHVRLADDAIAIGAAAPARSYLDGARVLSAAREAGAQAIHPGYGFLSEDPDFAEACEKAGIVFVGPTPDSMRRFALKHEARQIALECDVPVVPGTKLLEDENQARKEAERLGFPVLVKCVGGGGGIGMQRCESPERLREAFLLARRAGESYFGNPGVYLEKCVASPRHIEVQIFGDGKGNVVALGERECSIQRRYQKVLEEAGSPFVESAGRSLRDRLFSCAVRLGKSVGYRSAGTVELLVDDATGEFYFLEVNTRLQVEHAVTELVTGIDLVEWMLRQAAGEGPDLAAYSHQPKGHAIEVRLYAEDPGSNYRPCSGVLTEVRFPEHGWARFDTWIETGTRVTSHYDPLLAKVIVHADTREEAIRRLGETLDGCRIGGIPTNLS